MGRAEFLIDDSNEDLPENSQPDTASSPNSEQPMTREEWVAQLQYRRLHKPDEAIMQEAAEYKLLTPADEVRLGRRIQEGDTTARNDMVVANIRLAAMVAQKFQSPEIAFEDLLHEGIKALFDAADKFDPELGYRFSTFAGTAIYREIRKYIASMSRSVSLPPVKYSLIGATYLVEDILVQEHGRSVTVDEIAQHIGSEHTNRLKKDNAKDADDINLVRLVGAGSIRLNKAVSLSSGEGITIQDSLVDPTADTEEQVIEVLQNQLLDRVLSHLTDRERNIINQFYGLSGQEVLTHSQIGEGLGVSESQARRIKDNILERLRLAATEEGLADGSV